MGKLLGLAALAALTIGVAAPAAQAVPLGPLPGLTDQGRDIQLVRDGCGPFGHRSHFGYCKQNGPDEGGGYGPPPRFYGGGGYGGGYGFGGGGYGYARPRCFVRDTYYGPRRICRY